MEFDLLEPDLEPSPLDQVNMEISPRPRPNATTSPHTALPRATVDYTQLISPANLSQLNKLKRGATELSDQWSPKEAKSFLKYRLICVRTELDILRHTRHSLRESYEEGHIDKTMYHAERNKVLDHQETAELEEKELISQSKFLEQDLIESLQVAEDA